MMPSKPSSKPIAPADVAPGAGLTGLAIRAAGFVLGGFGMSQVLRLGGNVVLTRLLFPEAFGLMGLVTVFLVGLHLFSDIGIGPSIVQSERGSDPTYLDTAWTIQIGRGVSLWAIGLLASYPFAAFYDDPRLGPLLVASNTTSLVTGFQSTKINFADRNLNQKKLAAMDLTAQGAGLAVMIALAYAYRSVWALVVGSLTSDVVRTTMSHVFLPGPRNRLRYDPESARSLVRFGRWIFLSTVLAFVVTQCDRLVFGKLVDRATFGVYQTGANIAAIAPLALQVLAGHILLPVYSRILHGGGDLRALSGQVRRPLLVAGAFMLSGLAAGGPAAVRILYDERYHSAGWVVQLLAIAAWAGLLEMSNSNALLATGRSNLMAATNLAKLAGILVCVPTGYHLLGFPGAVAGYAAADGCKYAFSALAARQLGLSSVRQDMQLTIWFAATATLGHLVLGWVEARTDLAIVQALAVLVVVAAGWLPWARRLSLPELGTAMEEPAGAAVPADALPTAEEVAPGGRSKSAAS